MRKLHWVGYLVLSLVIVSASSVYAQDDGDQPIYERHEFAEIGVSFEIPADWTAEVSENELGGVTITIPESIYVATNNDELLVDSRQADVLFLPQGILGELSPYIYDNASFLAALQLQILLYGNTEQYELRLEDEILMDSGEVMFQLQRSERTPSSQSTSYSVSIIGSEYFFVFEEGIVWIHGHQYLGEGRDLSVQPALEHLIQSMTVDWSQSIVASSLTAADFFAQMGLPYHANNELIWSDGFHLNLIDENNTYQSYVNTQWRSFSTQGWFFDTYSSVYDTAGRFDIELVSENSQSFFLENLPADLQVGVYRTNYVLGNNLNGIRVYSGGLDKGTSVIIENVQDNHVTGRFYRRHGTTLYYGRFIDIPIPPTEACYSIGLPEDGFIQLNANFVYEELSDLAVSLNKGAYWFIEPIENDWRPIMLNISSSDGVGEAVTVTLQLDWSDDLVGTHVIGEKKPLSNRIYTPSFQIDVYLSGSQNSVIFRGELTIEEADGQLSGSFDGQMVYLLDYNLDLKLGTLSGTFTDIPLPDHNQCVFSSETFTQ